MLVPATRLALQHLGRPVPSAVLLVGFAALGVGLITLDAVLASIQMRLRGGIAEGNVAAAR